MFKTVQRALVSLIVVTAFAGVASRAALGSPACTLWASPAGSDSASGSETSPLGTVQKLVDRLHPGQTGCLQGGRYSGDVRFGHGGRSGAPLTLTAAPGQQAVIAGRISLPPGSDWITVSGLHLDGRSGNDLPSPTVDSKHDVFSYNDVTNGHTAICFELGLGDGSGPASDVMLQGNRIHGCGVLPANNHEHGIYVASSMRARIVDNWIYDNADRGIQLYWNAQWTTITGNVIDGNGEGVLISGDDGHVSSNNLIAGNLITNSTIRADVESWWPTSARGKGNLVSNNCVYGGKDTIDTSGGGFIARNNRTADPRYVDPSAGDYSLQPGSLCAEILSAHEALAVRTFTVRRHALFAWLRGRVHAGARGDVLELRGMLRNRHSRHRRLRLTVDVWEGSTWRRLAAVMPHRGRRIGIRRLIPFPGSRLRLRVQVHANGLARTTYLWTR